LRTTLRRFAEKRLCATFHLQLENDRPKTTALGLRRTSREGERECFPGRPAVSSRPHRGLGPYRNLIVIVFSENKNQFIPRRAEFLREQPGAHQLPAQNSALCSAEEIQARELYPPV